MKIYNLTENSILENFTNQNKKHDYFIVADNKEFAQISKLLDVDISLQHNYGNIDENVRFESHTNFDFLSFVFFEQVENSFVFEAFNLYYAKNFIALIVDKEDGLHNQFLHEFTISNFQTRPSNENLTFISYRFLNNAFNKMFDSMCQYENILSTIEMDILLQTQKFDFERIVSIKNNCFEVKKCLRLLLYVGDQIVVNDNNLIPENEMRFFRNIDMRINRMYEYATNIHEISEHLMELYNSTVNAKTNDLINKLTIFTVFATPITVLTGLYGMNFVNMPELQHQYGYFILLGVIVLIMLITFLILKKIKLL